jgi:hypothetical protein
LNRRGFYTIVTTFFFIIVIIIVIMLAVGLQGKVFGVQRGVDDKLLGYTVARETVISYLACHGEGTLKKQKLDSGICPLPALVSGLRIVQYDVPPCSAEEWLLGSVSSQSFVSYAPLAYPNGTRCMARIIISPTDTQR